MAMLPSHHYALVVCFKKTQMQIAKSNAPMQLWIHVWQFMHAFMHSHIYLCVRACMHACACTHGWMHVCMHASICCIMTTMQIYLRACMHACTGVYVCKYVHMLYIFRTDDKSKRYVVCIRHWAEMNIAFLQFRNLWHMLRKNHTCRRDSYSDFHVAHPLWYFACASISPCPSVALIPL